MKQKVNIASVKENTDNPRFIKDSKFKKLVKSIKAFPEMLEKRPIVVDEDMVVLGGNMRLKACKSAGLFEVWIDIAEGWTEKQKKEFIVKDNVGFGEWDWDILANEWNTEQLADWGLDVWQPELGVDQEDPGYTPPDDPFSDEDAGYKSQFGVIVTCKSESEQEDVFKRLQNEGLKCKIVVT